MGRPKSVTVICGLLIAGSLLALFAFGKDNPEVTELMNQSPLPISIQVGLVYLGCFVTFVCGVAMLYGKNWARLIYVGNQILGIIIGLFTPVSNIRGIVYFAITAFFLFRPKANEYFVGVAGQKTGQ